jgi:superfamily I DNA and RNA helicase
MIKRLGVKSEGNQAGIILEDILCSLDKYTGKYFNGFPVINSIDGNIKLDGLLCSEQLGIIIFHFVEGRELTEQFADEVDSIHLRVASKLQELRILTKGRNLLIPIHSITFAPVARRDIDKELSDRLLLCREKNDIEEIFNGINWDSPELLTPAVSKLQSLSGLQKKKKRPYTTDKVTKGSVLKHLEDKLATLDDNQTRAVLENIDGVQRIRGLAGSGKTIVLARKVAHIHTQNPHWKIAITFNSRSLKEQFKRLIETFYSDANNGELPDFDNIKIIHAWGSTKSEGIYYNACKAHNVEYHDLNSSKAIKKTKESNFQSVCRHFLENKSKDIFLYDLILIDEAQDFSIEFLQLCYGLLNEPKRLIYAYDELQNLGDEAMPSPDEIWGNDENGNPIVKFNDESQDIILDVCYRNPGPILTAAHSLGFGLYREQMVQMFDHADLWREIGYEVIDGSLESGKNVSLARSDRSSPCLLTHFNTKNEIVDFLKFETMHDQARWIAAQIEDDLNNQELLPSDIIVIHPNALKLRSDVGILREILYDKGINSSIAGVTSSPDEFFSDNSITFTSIYRAKGNEAPVVYIMHAEHCDGVWELSKKRNILFTAMTRSKAWLKVCGVGNGFNGLLSEFGRVRDNDFKLNFIYPTDEQRQKMKLVNRDMTKEERSRVKAAKANAQNLVALLDGEVNVEDIPDELRQLLIQKLLRQ